MVTMTGVRPSGFSMCVLRYLAPGSLYDPNVIQQEARSFVFRLTWESHEFVVVRVDYYRYCVAYP
jgi:hypothetical protein